MIQKLVNIITRNEHMTNKVKNFNISEKYK